MKASILMFHLLAMTHIAPAAAEETGWPLLEEVPIADGEDTPTAEGVPRYFSFGSYALSFNTLSPDSGNESKKLVLFSEEGGADKVIEADPGSVWLFDRVWGTPGHELLLWKGKDARGTFLQMARLSPFESLGILPAVPTKGSPARPDWKHETYPQAITNGRIYFHHGVPDLLKSYFPDSTKINARQPFWPNVAWPAHAGLLADLRNRVLMATETPGNDSNSKNAATDVRKLLGTKTQAIEPATLAGDWRVRSIQGSEGFHIAYPFFNARITMQDGGLYFEKTTGSQRRSGHFHADTANRLIFLGGKSVNDDPQVPYSGSSDPAMRASGAPADSDTFGTLEQLGADQLLMIMDPDEHGNYEIYELRRAKR